MLDIQFARSGDVHVAYHVVGDGPIDIVYVQGAWSHLEVQWELPAYRRFCEMLGAFARVILFDKRGMGMSDRVPGTTPLDVRMDDIRAVMDATGSDSASLIGASEGGPLSMLFAAAHPERTRSLILMGAEVRERKDEEWPWGESTLEEFESSTSAKGTGKPSPPAGNPAIPPPGSSAARPADRAPKRVNRWAGKTKREPTSSMSHVRNTDMSRACGIGRYYLRRCPAPIRSSSLATRQPPTCSSTTINNVSSPATVPSTPPRTAASTALATTWAAPGGVLMTTRLPVEVIVLANLARALATTSLPASSEGGSSGTEYPKSPSDERRLVAPISVRGRETRSPG